jgi:hypothetical protein
MFLIPATDAHADMGMACISLKDPMDYRSWAPSGFIPGGIIYLSDIRIGETCYRLRQTLLGEFLPVDKGLCEFWVGGFSPTFIGNGVQALEAYHDWRDRVHEAFQSLYGKAAFELSEEEQQQWRVLENIIDVVGYRNETPVVVRQLGKVVQSRPLPRKIEWIDGKSEIVRLENMPGEFAGYKPGQPFEADVERDPLTWRLLRVRSIRRISTITPMTPAKLQEFWQSLPATNSLPISDRKWTES